MHGSSSDLDIEQSDSVPAEVWERWDRQHVWHAFTQMRDYAGIIVDHAKGCWVTDIHGNQYLDASGAIWCITHGYRHPEIDHAVRKQLERVAHVTSLGMSNPTTIQLARELVEITPQGLEHVFFSSDGSSAVEVALKLAFQFWQQVDESQSPRTKYVAIGNAYHGDTLGSVSVGGVARFHAMFHPLLFDVLRGPCPDTFRPSARGGDLCSDYLEQYEQLFASHKGEIAAVVIEPLIQCAAGIVCHPTGFLKGIASLARQHDILLIADEIAVGFGKTGKMFACEHESVSPDFLCLGKGLTGGYMPMAATLTTGRVWQAFLGEYAESKSFFHGHTFSGNPLAAAAALASLRIFRNESTLQNVVERGEQLRNGLRSLEQHPNVGDMRGLGLILGIELVADKATKQGFAWSDRLGQQVAEACLRRNVWIRPIGNVLIAMPPLSIDAAEIDVLAKTIEESIEEVLGPTSKAC